MYKGSAEQLICDLYFPLRIKTIHVRFELHEGQNVYQVIFQTKRYFPYHYLGLVGLLRSEFKFSETNPIIQGPWSRLKYKKQETNLNQTNVPIISNPVPLIIPGTPDIYEDSYNFAKEGRFDLIPAKIRITNFENLMSVFKNNCVKKLNF